MLTYLKTIFSHSPWRSARLVMLMIFLGLIEGIGLLLLVPLLSLAGFSFDGGVSKVSTSILKVFDVFSLPNSLIGVLFVYVVIVSILALLQFISTLWSSHLQQSFVRAEREKLYSAIMGAKWSFLLERKISDFTHLLTSEIGRIGTATNQVTRLFSTTVVGLVYLSAALAVSPFMVLTASLSAILLLILLRAQNKGSVLSGEKTHQSLQDLYSAVMEHLSGMKIAKSYGKEKNHLLKLADIGWSIEKRQLAFTKAYAASSMYFKIGGVLVFSVICYVAVGILQISISRMLILLFIFARLFPKVSSLQNNYQHTINMLPAFFAVNKMRRFAIEHQEIQLIDDQEQMRANQKIVFKGVSYQYKGAKTRALDDVVLEIKAKSTVALVGESGAGKSTLADLLVGLLECQGGQILIDGIVLTSNNLLSWRGSVGYVPQDTFLFHDTIRANLLWAKNDASNDDLWQCLKLASAHEFVFNMKNGIDTVIGDRGVRLSGGERQRLALARVLLRKPSLLLLDEATSSLDTRNEARIQNALESLHGELTIVIIAHRLSTIIKADEIIVLQKGKVVDQGNFKTLSRKTGPFLDLLEADSSVKNEEMPILITSQVHC